MPPKLRDRKPRVRLSSEAKVVKRLLMTRELNGIPHLRDEFEKALGQMGRSNPSKDIKRKERFFKALNELKKAPTAPYLLQYKGYKIRINPDARVGILSIKHEGRNLPHTLLKRWVDDIPVDQKPLARDFKLGDSTVRRYIQDIESEMKGQGYEKRFTKERAGGRPSYLKGGKIREFINEKRAEAIKTGKPLKVAELARDFGCSGPTMRKYLKMK